MGRVPLVLTLAVGALLVAAPLYVLPDAASPTYRHAVHPADAVGSPGVAYEDLSADARTVFDAARTDGAVSVERTTDPAFVTGRTVVADDGERFVVETVRRSPSTALQWLRQALSTFGIVLVGVTAATLRDGPEATERLPLGFAVVGVTALGVAVGGVGPAGAAALLVGVVATQFVALWWGVATVTGRIVPRPLADD